MKAMTWIQRYQLREYFRSSIWILPAFGILAGVLLVNGLHMLEETAGWRTDFDPEAARALFATLSGAMFTFIVFLSSILLLVVQISSAQLTPRIIGVAFRDRVTRFSLTLFTFTFTFTLAVLLRIEDSVPAITAHSAAYLFLISTGVFLFLIDHMGKLLRPSGAMRSVAHLGHAVIRSVYPRLLSGQVEPTRGPARPSGGVPSSVVSAPTDGVLLAFEPAGLAALAQEADCMIELVPQVGDFLAVGSPLFRVFGDHGGPSASALCQRVAFGQERTMEQDPVFVFRIVVDIASKALSPGINDPTTAVLAAGGGSRAARRARLLLPRPAVASAGLRWESFCDQTDHRPRRRLHRIPTG
jgi:uncharacterized membrane protein